MQVKQPSIIQECLIWITAKQTEQKGESKTICPTRDVFQSRLNILLVELRKNGIIDNQAFLLTAVIGEIGNNSFDHNLGAWRDLPGVYFNFDFKNRVIVLADRGQGILATIQKVQPAIKTDQEAIQTAFTKIISGRYPEKRGNGLKFVRQVTQNNNWHLEFYSGQASCHIKKGQFNLREEPKKYYGVAAIIYF